MYKYMEKCKCMHMNSKSIFIWMLVCTCIQFPTYCGFVMYVCMYSMYVCMYVLYDVSAVPFDSLDVFHLLDGLHNLNGCLRGRHN